MYGIKNSRVFLTTGEKGSTSQREEIMPAVAKFATAE
jgi:hypothetical protein